MKNNSVKKTKKVALAGAGGKKYAKTGSTRGKISLLANKFYKYLFIFHIFIVRRENDFCFFFQGEKRELDGKSFLGTILAMYIYFFITRFIVILTH